MRRRKASRPGQATCRPPSTLSSSRTVKGGKAPGKLAVARAAKTSSAGSASRRGLAPRAPKLIDRRCSVSLISRRAIEQQPLFMTGKVGCRHEQVERVAIGNERCAGLAGGHGVKGVEQETRKAGAPEGRGKPARTHEIGELAPDFLARLRRDGALDRVAPPTEHQPEQRTSPEFGEAGKRTGVGIDQHIGVGAAQPEIGQRVDRLAGLQRMGQKHAIDTTGAGARDDVRHDAEPEARLGKRSLQNFEIDGLARTGFNLGPLARGEIGTGAGEMPDLLGDAMHIHGKTDAAVADQREPQFLLSMTARWRGFGRLSTSDALELRPDRQMIRGAPRCGAVMHAAFGQVERSRARGCWSSAAIGRVA